ncbi:MAG: Lrp/AsnC ligand binding domain-containing protein [Candidatus Hodarchaeota archaeon]
MVNSDIGAEDQVLMDLKSMDEVKEAYLVYGVYDIIAKIDAPTIEGLKGIIYTQIRRLTGVQSTLTMIAAEKIT